MGTSWVVQWQRIQETWVWALSQEDPLEKKMAIYSNILAWETPWIEEPCRGWSMGVTRVRHAKAFDYVDHNKLWKILKEIGIPPYTCLLRKLYVGQEARVRTICGTTGWFQIGKGLSQGCIFSPCLFNLYSAYIMQNARDRWMPNWNQDCWEKYQ